MPKKYSRAEQRKRLNVLAKRQGISLGELQNRLKSDGDDRAQEETEGVGLTEAGQDGAAEEGGSDTPASGREGGSWRKGGESSRSRREGTMIGESGGMPHNGWQTTDNDNNNDDTMLCCDGGQTTDKDDNNNDAALCSIFAALFC